MPTLHAASDSSERGFVEPPPRRVTELAWWALGVGGVALVGYGLVRRRRPLAPEVVARTVTVGVDPEAAARAWQADPASRQYDTPEFRPAPGGRGAEVTLRWASRVPTRGFAGLMAKSVGADPVTALAKALRRFKQQVEVGEVPTTDGQPRGAGRRPR
jgi:hypothetical protein